MNIDGIRSYLTSNRILNHPEITLLGRGEANINYLATDGNRKYVVRVARNDVPRNSRFEAEHHFMLFVESLGIEFASRSVRYDPTYELHIVSYAEGKDISVVDLNEAQIKVFIDQLKLLDSIRYAQYLEWCGKDGQTPRKPQTLVARNKINIDDRLQTIHDFTDADPFARKVFAWAEPKVEVLYSAQQDAMLRTKFLHDDLRWNEGGGNIKAMGNKLVFIDWELSGFFEDAVPEVGDVLGSIPSTADQTVPRRLYQTYIESGDSTQELNRAIKYGVLWGKMGNPLWAAERYLVLKDRGHSEIERYKVLAELGMKDAQPFFELPLEQWFQNSEATEPKLD